MSSRQFDAGASKTAPSRPGATGRTLLRQLSIPSDRLGASDQGMLLIGGEPASALLEKFGSPLYVAVEETIRTNYRRIQRAFAERWDAPINVMYAIKTNNALAVRAILSTEGAGGDCFGLGELHATERGGADLRRVVMNGSNKTDAELAAAVERDIVVNIDGPDEIPRLQKLATAVGRHARVNLRLKLLPPGLDDFSAEFFKSAGSLRESVRHSKWGMTVAAAAALVRDIGACSHIELKGYSCHIGRFSARPAAYGLVGQALGEAVVGLFDATGFWPALLDLGGGWARQREPESRQPDLNPHTIEEYAAAATGRLRAALASAGRPWPELWLEPGRYIIGNAYVLLTRVGTIKHDDGLCWVHVDASTNDFMRIETSKAWYHILPASRMDLPMDRVADIVGGTCIPSILGAARPVPDLQAGDCMAVLDAGMYAEAISNQFNSIPRPTTVLVSEAGCEVIKQRETVDDLFARHVVPGRLSNQLRANHVDTRP